MGSISELIASATKRMLMKRALDAVSERGEKKDYTVEEAQDIYEAVERGMIEEIAFLSGKICWRHASLQA